MKIEYNIKEDATTMTNIKIGECFWFAGHLYLKIAHDGYNAFDISSNERVTFNEKKDVNPVKGKERGMTREEELDWLCRLRSAIYVYMPKEWLIPMKNALEMAIKALEQEPCDDTVSRGVFEQVMWERDTAIEQLRELGYELGQKIELCDDCVSRQSVLEIFGYVMDYWKEHVIDVEPHEIEDALIKQYEFTAKQLSELPSVLPKRERERNSMTNQGKLSTITAEEFYDKIWWLLHEYGKRYLDSRLAIIEWLQVDSEWWNAPYKTESEDK